LDGHLRSSKEVKKSKPFIQDFYAIAVKSGHGQLDGRDKFSVMSNTGNKLSPDSWWSKEDAYTIAPTGNITVYDDKKNDINGKLSCVLAEDSTVMLINALIKVT